MAVLDATARKEVATQFAADLSVDHDPVGTMTKADLLAAVGGIDDYFNTNASAMNQAIPATPRAALTTAQKARLGQLVLAKRWINGA